MNLRYGICERCDRQHNELLGKDYCLGCQRDDLLNLCKTLRKVASLACQTMVDNGLTDEWICNLTIYEIPVGFGKNADDVIAKAEREIP